MIETRLKIVIAAGLFAGLALSPKLWLSDRLYPLTPVFSFLGRIPEPFDFLIYTALLAILIAIAIGRKPAKLIGVFAVIAIIVALFDQSRWQPWFYQYLAMLIAVGLYYHDGIHDDRHHPALNVCRLIVGSIYFWSGAQKLHTDFVGRIFPWLIEPFAGWLPHSMAPIIHSFGFVAPFIEIGIGIGLLTSRFRQYAVAGAITMHSLILLCIGPLGRNWNNVVWPWNITMMVLVVLLFWKRPDLPAREIVWPRGQRLQRIVLILFGIAPALSFLNLWDDYLSSALYAGYRNEPILQLTNSLADRLPKEILNCVYLTEKPGVNVINLLHWSLNEMNVANYPAPRIYRSVARYICSYTKQPSEMNLIIRRTHVLFSSDTQVSYDCPALLR